MSSPPFQLRTTASSADVGGFPWRCRATVPGGRRGAGYGRRRILRRDAPVALVGPGKWGRLVLRDLVALGAETIVVDRSGRNRDLALAAGAAAVVDSIDALPDRVAARS